MFPVGSGAGVLLLLVLAAPAAARDNPDGGSVDYSRIAAIVSYVAGDYENALKSNDQSELNEQVDFLDDAIRVLAAANDSAGVARLGEIVQRVRRRDAAPLVRAELLEYERELGAVHGLVQSPPTPPDMATGQLLYAQHCAACHGERGDGTNSLQLKPPPASFVSGPTQDLLTPYRVHQRSRFGVPGTAMPPFPDLTDAQRWGVAFHVLTLATSPCDQAAGPPVSLATLAGSSNRELGEAFGPTAVACLRRQLKLPNSQQGLAALHQSLTDVVRLAESGQQAAARSALTNTYLSHIEPLEPKLRATAPQDVAAIEEHFRRLRTALGAPESLRTEVDRLEARMAEIQTRRSSAPQGATFWTALLIIIREGFEAAVILAALLAALQKSGATRLRWTIHAGWISALVVSVAAYLAFGATLSGAHREWLEASIAAFAVGLLLYAALWLNDRATMSQFMQDIRGQMQVAAGRGAAWGSFFVAFTAVGRETFETAIFLQSLDEGHPKDVAAGAATGGVVLLAFIFFVRRYGFRLPMKRLFQVSTAVLLATSVMVLGKAIHAFQELDVIRGFPIGSWSVPSLGLHADAAALVAQLALAIASAWWMARSPSPRSPRLDGQQPGMTDSPP